MDAMIFAAGLGTRLRPLTNELPKALVEVDGVPVVEHVARRLIDAGADRLVINTHHFGDRIEAFVRSRHGFGVEVRFSHERDAPLDTGGGLLRAAPHFRRDAPFFLHNCDVLSDLDLQALYAAHGAHAGHATQDGARVLATLAVLPPRPERYLIFDERGLCGYAPRGGGEDVTVRDAEGAPARRHFTGVHVASPALLDALLDLPRGDGAFSIISAYIALVRQGITVMRHEQPGVWWTDIGSHAELAAAREHFTVSDAARRCPDDARRGTPGPHRSRP